MKSFVRKPQKSKGARPTTVATQRKKSQKPSLAIRDQRPEAIAQRKMQATIFNSPQVQRQQAIQRMANQYATRQNRPIQQKSVSLLSSNVFQLARRTYGNSGKLARARWNKKTKAAKKKLSYGFKVWKKGREAQHLIPAAVAKEFKIPSAWLDSAVNGIMLPSGRTTTNHLRLKVLDKGKIHHIKGGGAHPVYNRKVKKFLLNEAGWKVGKVPSYSNFVIACSHLRLVNRPKKTGSAKGYSDDVKIPALT